MTCEKCGHDDVLVRWHGEGAYHKSRGFYASCHSDYGETRGKPREEHLHYTCRTCQYDWTGELTPDTTGGSPSPEVAVLRARVEALREGLREAERANGAILAGALPALEEALRTVDSMLTAGASRGTIHTIIEEALSGSGHSCVWCPLEVRDLFALAANAVTSYQTGRETKKMYALKQGVEHYQAEIDAHFAARRVLEADAAPTSDPEGAA